MLQQTEGRERTADKLPTFAQIDDWWYPVRLSCEQCSSELTARYKAEIVESGKSKAESRMVDLTGGYGVDTYFLSEQFAQTDYVEQNEELCRIATHNFSLPFREGAGVGSISVHNSTAENFLQTAGLYDLIFLDPARRDSHGGKVFRLEDCTPNVVELLPTLLAHLTPKGRIMLKLSPMLDLTQALSRLSPLASLFSWNIHVVAVKNEVKEVLLVSQESKVGSQKAVITAIDLAKKDQAFLFTREEERDCRLMNEGNDENDGFLYEPNAAILKAGAYKLIAQRFGLKKADTNTHLYFSDTLIPDFPGKAYKVLPSRERMRVGPTANVLVRNYPLTPEQLKKKLHLRDGGTTYIIGCRVNGKPVLLECERII
jgi:hypothetical protein